MQDNDKLQKVYQLFVESPHDTVPLNMLSDLFKFAGYSVSENELNSITTECPENGIKFEQFKAICKKLDELEVSKEDLCKILYSLSNDESGFIDANTLVNSLSKNKSILKEEEIDEILNIFKPNADGKISIEYILSVLYK